jgi:hypothetical protein
MASKPDMDQIVLAYAQGSPIFISPQSMIDVINPAPSGMSAGLFGEFINSLVAALNAANVVTEVVAGDMRASTIWDDVSLSLFGRQ